MKHGWMLHLLWMMGGWICERKMDDGLIDGRWKDK